MSKKNNTRLGAEHTNKVFLTLRYLHPSERKRLVKYLHSPYFNQSKTLAKLGEIMLEHIERGKEGFDRQAVWKKIFPGDPYDDVSFRKYCSDLLKHVEGFMAQETITHDETQQAIDTLDFIVRRKIEPLYSGSIKQIRNDLDKVNYRTLDYFKKVYFTERLYYTMMDFDVKVNVRANIEEISNSLDLFYWIEKLKLYCSMLSQQRTRNFNYQVKFMDEIRNYLINFPIEDVPELAVYYYSLLMLLEAETVEHYYNLRRLLDKYGAEMPQREAIELFDSALHYCTGKINKGNKEFLQEYFDLFEDAIHKKIFLLEGELAPWRFNNLIAAALRLGKLEWAENFVDNYREYLPPESRENTYSFNLARVYLYQKKYEKVLGLLSNVEYEDIGYNLIGKAMLTITYYEMDEYTALDSFLESFRVFLNRYKNFTPARKRGYLNLIKYTRRLTRLMPGDKTTIEKLREEIIREKATTVNHEWLLEKLAELE